ncbi:hypothetical protein F385_2120 [Pantoea agglomerans 299R]|nr:hypothetical protein F385_2120 [Pantoea agglomerans 299R]
MVLSVTHGNQVGPGPYRIYTHLFCHRCLSLHRLHCASKYVYVYTTTSGEDQPW